MTDKEMKLTEVTTGEEDEEIAFECRANCFRYDATVPDWKERGTGNLRLLKAKIGEPYCRTLIRRDKTLKVCVNFFCDPAIVLNPIAGTEKAWTFTCLDFSDGEVKETIFAVRFRTPEDAQAFKKEFQVCQKVMSEIKARIEKEPKEKEEEKPKAEEPKVVPKPEEPKEEPKEEAETSDIE
eukprot:gnl/Dysnectes_brevis/496_a549_6746.p2 GENE.gnl/Dysnectes_brevis/496_a549_6746~~gnl/Dysnectes_brevis/496_a549_6746.p2  ORF type:complete len:190 (+),score=66.60 gnl/Dysnectes_brevis/496_a549_6746:29-571(+)